ncbi:peptidoglycan recognition protein family protein [Pseudonocardia sp.]|uniref:peptidoglycan recognition protein family protein n=1 Tax=Pseudonocardia sp. TaxID=60912 RepID=UPI002D7F59AE|nr:N-acetylmuramoyl-L-alanine amidase [Pseudonocardia sp.]
MARYQPGQRNCILMAAYRRYGLHTAVSSASSLYNYFAVSGRATSHFYIPADGSVEQYIDTKFRSTAHLNGNHDTITVETQDIGGPFPKWNTNGSDVPAWTKQQVEALAKLGAWLHRTHGIRLQLCPNSKPGSLGFAYHRQGIDPWRVSGGEFWSKARGKVCPGDRRVAQIPQIVNRSRQLVTGVAGGDTDVALTKADIPIIQEAVHGMKLGRSDNTGGLALQRVMTLPQRADVAGAILGAKYKEYVDEKGDGTRDMRTVADILFSTHANALQVKAQLAGLTEVLKTLATGQGLDADELVTRFGAKVDEVFREFVDEARVELVVDDTQG